MQYILAAHTDENGWRSLTKEFVAYIQDLAKAGALVGNYPPEPSSAAKVVRYVNGGTEIQDGPFAALDEQMTGLYIIDVPDEESALLWAERHPAARFGAIEVRPVSPPPGREAGATEDPTAARWAASLMSVRSKPDRAGGAIGSRRR